MDTELSGLTEKLAAQITDHGKKKVTVLDFTDLQGASSEFGKYIAEQLTVNLVMGRAIVFEGNAPSIDSSSFAGDNNLIIYPASGTTGYGAKFANIPTWNPQVQTTGTSFGVKNNQYGFNITGNNNLVVVVEGCSNLTNPAWFPVGTNTLIGGSSYFSDPKWTNYPGRFYRLRSP